MSDPVTIESSQEPNAPAPTLVLDEQGAVAENTSYRMIAPALAAEPLRIEAPDGSYFAWTPRELVYRDSDGMLDYIVGSSAASLEVRGREARYRRTYELAPADDVFLVQANGVKHYTVLYDHPRDPAEYLGTGIEFGVSGSVNGLPLLPGVHDRIEAGVFTLPEPVIKDAKGDEIRGRYEVVDTDAGQQLTVWFDAAFLNDAMYPVMIDPTVIVASAYYTSGNSRLNAVLPNGWIVSTMRSATSGTSGYWYYYLSKDNGQTWTLAFGSGTSATGGAVVGGITIAAWGTTVYALTTGGGVSRFYKIDVVAGTGYNVEKATLEAAVQTAYGSGSMAVDSNGVIHIAYAVKLTTRTNSFNIRYARSNDGGATFTTFDVTTSNTTGQNNTNPVVVLNSQNKPYIVHNNDTSSLHAILMQIPTDTIGSFIANQIGGDSYMTGAPSAAVDGNDDIHVVWHSLSSQYPSFNNIRYYRTGRPAQVDFLTTGNTYHQRYPTIVADRYNRVFVLFQGRMNGTYDQVRYMRDDGSGWSTPVNLTNNTTANVQYPNAVWSEFEYNSDGYIRYTYMDGSTVKYDEIDLNTAPLAPSALVRTNYDATQAADFVYQNNDADLGDVISAQDAEVYDTTNVNAPVWTLSKASTTTAKFTVPANTLINGKTYQWRVRTYDSRGSASPWSALATLKCSAAPLATLVNPAPSTTIPTDSVIATGSYFQAGGVAQKSYGFRLYDVSGTQLLQDSGEKYSTANTYRFDNLVNNTPYVVEFWVTSQDGITTTTTKVPVLVQYTPPPAPVVTATNNATEATVTIEITDAGATQNLVRNSDFEAPTGTSAVFSDAMTNASNWKIEQGAVTFSAAGATTGANVTILSAKDAAWNIGTSSSITVQATFAMPATVTPVRLYLFKDLSNYYYAYLQSNSMWIYRRQNGVSTGLTGTLPTTVGNATYTMTLSLDNTGRLTVNLYNGTSAIGTPFHTSYCIDQSLTCAFTYAAGSDAGVTISNAVAYAAAPDVWSLSLPTAASASLVGGANSGDRALQLSGAGTRSISQQIDGLTPGETYTLSAYVRSDTASTVFLCIEGEGFTLKSADMATSTVWMRVTHTVTLPAGVTSVTIRGGTSGASVQFDSFQLEQGESATPYIQNDSTVAPATEPSVVTMTIYRRRVDRNKGEPVEEWSVIAEDITATTYVDHFCPTGFYEYGVKGTAGNGAVSAYGTVQIESSFSGQWIIDEQNIANRVCFQYNNRNTPIKRNGQASFTETQRTYARKRRGVANYKSGTLSAMFVKDGETVESQLSRLEAMEMSPQSFLLKLDSGGIYRVQFLPFDSDAHFGGQYADISIEWAEVDSV